MSENNEHDEPVIGDAPPSAPVLLSNGVYDKLVAASLYLLPMVASAYFGLAQIWGFPKAEEVLGTVAVLETLLGALLKLSRAQYKGSDARFDGQIDIRPGETDEQTDLFISLDPASVAKKKELTVRVERDF